MTKILVFANRHENRYFDASSPEAILRAYYTILKERFEQGWYPEPVDRSKESAVEIEQYENLPEFVIDLLPGDVKKMIEKVKSRMAREDKEFKQEKMLWDALEQVVIKPIDEAVNIFMPKKFVGTKNMRALEWLITELIDDSDDDCVYTETLEKP